MYSEASPHQAGAGKEGSVPSDKWGNDPGQVYRSQADIPQR